MVSHAGVGMLRELAGLTGLSSQLTRALADTYRGPRTHAGCVQGEVKHPRFHAHLVTCAHSWKHSAVVDRSNGIDDLCFTRLVEPFGRPLPELPVVPLVTAAPDLEGQRLAADVRQRAEVVGQVADGLKVDV